MESPDAHPAVRMHAKPTARRRFFAGPVDAGPVFAGPVDACPVDARW
jgi:hypothetical protein